MSCPGSTPNLCTYPLTRVCTAVPALLAPHMHPVNAHHLQLLTQGAVVALSPSSPAEGHAEMLPTQITAVGSTGVFGVSPAEEGCP